MTAKIIPFGGITSLDLDPDIILESNKGKLEGFLMMGYDKRGEFFACSTYADGGMALWLMELCKQRLMESGT